MRKVAVKTVLSIVILVLTAFMVMVPELNKLFVKAEKSLVDKVLENYVQPELFYLDSYNISGGWTYKVEGYDQGVLKGYYRPDVEVKDWRPVDAPFMFYAVEGNNSIWLRRNFKVPEEFAGKRIRLVFLGAFYYAKVWVNGYYVGEHEGYFAPFAFDVADKLNYKGENVVVVYLSTPVEKNLNNKQAITGVFNDWDMKPYPRWAIGKLPVKYEWTVPIGLWRPVLLVATGQVASSVVLVDAYPDAEARYAQVRVRFYLTNAGPSVSGLINFSVECSGESVPGTLTFSLPENGGGWAEATLTIESPRLWWVWDQGSPSLYTLRYEILVNGEVQGRGEVSFGIRAVQGEFSSQRALFTLNGRRVFLRGTNYISDFMLVKSTYSVLKRDILMIRAANINFVRVHAHVEPPEFYSLADEAGIAVQADGPLIWAYASNLRGAAYSKFLEKAQKIYAEMVFTLYNHPSVVIWTVHNEPPWAMRWMGNLYRRRVNSDLDNVLASLISALDAQKRPIIKGSGYDDQHVYYGWFSGSWADFKKDLSPFPTEFGAEALPSPESPFWKLVNVAQWPVKEEDPLFFEFMYRGFYWGSGFVKIPYGLPSEYPSLESYIRASQSYQAKLIRTAVTRYRILKFNVTVGEAQFMFRDCFPGITFSIVDYYAVPKQAYHVLAELYKPTKVLVDWGGDYVISGTDVEYDVNSTIRLWIWLVNDAYNVEGSVNVTWALLDTNTSRVILKGSKQVSLPGSTEPAVLVEKMKIEVPPFFDGKHVLVFGAAIVNGSKVLDHDYIFFEVNPASKLSFKIEGGAGKLSFLVKYGENEAVVDSKEGYLTVIVPSGVSFSLVGPSLDPSNPYLPVYFEARSLEPGEYNYTLRMVRGALYRLEGIMPLNHNVPAVNVEVVPLRPLEGPYILSYDTSILKLLLPLNYTGSAFVVPAQLPLNISVSFNGKKIVERNELTFEAGQTVMEKGFALVAAESLMKRVMREYGEAKRVLEEISRRGFYVGLSSNWMSRASKIMQEANETLRDEPEKSVTLLLEASTIFSQLSRHLVQVYASAQVSFLSIFIILLFSALGVVAITVNEDETRPLANIVAILLLGVLVYFSLPSIAEVSTVDMLLAAYLGFAIIAIIFLAPHFLEDLRSERGLPLLAALESAVAIAVRNMRRRRVRTMLALIAISATAIAVTNLFSMTFFTMSRELTTTVSVSPDVENAFMAYKVGYFSLEELSYVASQPEVRGVGFKVESVPRAEPYGQVALTPVRAFISFWGYIPYCNELSEIIEPAGALKTLTLRSDAVIISKTWKEYLRLGDRIIFEGRKLEVVGFFDPDRLRSLKDIGGYGSLPKAMLPSGNVDTADPNEVVIVSPTLALSVNGRITRLYGKTYSSEGLRTLAKRLTMQANYIVAVRPAGGYITVYYIGSIIEVRGVETFIVILLAAMNVGVVVLASVYERRGEIFTLASIGLNPTHIFSIFMAEAIILGFIGGGLGYILSFTIFRFLQVFNVNVPIDVKTSVYDAALVLFVAVASSAVAAMIPALKASAYATPSLRRRWKLEAERMGEEWFVDIPTKVSREKAEDFAQFLVERLREKELGLEVSVYDVSLKEKESEAGKTYVVRFTYGRGGGRPFTAYCRIVLEPYTKDFYRIKFSLSIRSPYGRFVNRYIHEVASFVRTIVLEWASLRVRVLTPVGKEISRVIDLVKHYNPQLLILASRGTQFSLRDLKRSIKYAGLRVPAIEVVDMSSRNFEEIVANLRELVKKADIICIDSDDGVLSAALSLASILENKRVVTKVQNKYIETNLGKFVGMVG